MLDRHPSDRFQPVLSLESFAGGVSRRTHPSFEYCRLLGLHLPYSPTPILRQVHVSHTFWAILLMGTLATMPMLAEQVDTNRAASPAQKASKPSFGSVSGRIFLITKGGDLKPARMAHVFLFFEHGPGSAAVMSAGGGYTPGLIYLKENLELTEDANKSGASVRCRSDLLNADKAALATVDWAREHKLTAHALILDADEEGNFSMGKITPGVYELVARGRAGVNDAYWLQEITVKPGEKTEVKVSSVEVSCADLS